MIGAIIIALGARDLNYAAPLFAFGVVVGAFVGFAHEVERGVIDDLDGLERATHRGVTSAAPLIALRTLRGLSPDMRNPLGCAVYQPASDYAAALRHTLSTLEDARVVAVLGSTPRDGAHRNRLIHGRARRPARQERAAGGLRFEPAGRHPLDRRRSRSGRAGSGGQS
ncbi:MAG: hypothetical protein NVV62_14045 [Terricaulis sp.]|nr:hypothetical protein [Terricaulis sp.]